MPPSGANPELGRVSRHTLARTDDQSNDVSPLVTVAIFSHDHEAFVAECIESMLAQSVRSLEVVIVDDASKDGTWPVIQRYAGDPAVTDLVRHERSVGPPLTYVDGAQRARGRYLVPVDADDYALTPYAIEQGIEMLERDQGAGFVHSAYEVVDVRGRRIRTEWPAHRERVLPSRDAFKRLLFHNFVHHSGVVIRHRHYLEVGGYDASLENSADWDLWLRLAARHDVGYLAKPLYAYRQHRGQFHRTRLHVAVRQQRENLLVIDRAIDFAGADARRFRNGAYASNHLGAAGPYFAAFMPGLALRSLASALRMDPLLVLRSTRTYTAIARLAVTRILGRRGYNALRRVRDILTSSSH